MEVLKNGKAFCIELDSLRCIWFSRFFFLG